MSKTLRYLERMEHGIIAVSGSGKTGKSGTLHGLLALCQPDRPVCMMDPMDFDISIFPDHYSRVTKASEVPVGSICVIEDVSRVFNARGSSKDPTLSKWLGIISHRSNIVAFTVQNLSECDISFMRSQDVVVAHKTMHGTDMKYERPEHRVDQAFANYYIEKACGFDSSMDPRSWTFFPRFNETIGLPLPDWWDDRHSKIFREAEIC